MKNDGVKFLNIKISDVYFTDILGKEVSDVLLSQYDRVMEEAQNMKVPKDESDAYFTLVDGLKSMKDLMNYPPAKLYMEKNLKKFAKKVGISHDLMPYFFITIFGRYPNKGEVLLDLVFQVAIEFTALILIKFGKKKN